MINPNDVIGILVSRGVRGQGCDGTAYLNRGVGVNGVYQTIAHVAGGQIKYFVDESEIPESVKKQVERQRDDQLQSINYCEWLKVQFPGYYCHDIGRKYSFCVYVLHPSADLSMPRLWSVVDNRNLIVLYCGDSFDSAIKVFNEA